MAAICPTVTAYDLDEYRAQINRVATFARRIHIDLMDGEFAPTKSPDLKDIWIPKHKFCDIHLMYQHPMKHIKRLIELRPHMVIIHKEANVDHMQFAARLHREGIKAGLAILQDTPAFYTQTIMHSFDHILVFSGNLGHHGGTADLAMLNKVQEAQQLHTDVEIGWDGGIDDANARKLVDAGVDVLNVGGFVQKSSDPAKAYARLKALVG